MNGFWYLEFDNGLQMTIRPEDNSKLRDAKGDYDVCPCNILVNQQISYRGETMTCIRSSDQPPIAEELSPPGDD